MIDLIKIGFILTVAGIAGIVAVLFVLACLAVNFGMVVYCAVFIPLLLLLKFLIKELQVETTNRYKNF